MQESWRELDFGQVIEDVSGGNKKIPQSTYLENGAVPIVDQGKALIGGYTNEVESICKATHPVIIFGDHTRCFKYVDFPFAMGADGVKVLKPKIPCDTKYLFHFLSSVRLQDGGYDRHFKYLKRIQIVLPPLPQQRRIAAILDKADSLREKRRQAIAKLDALLQSVFIEMFGDPVTNPKGWPVVKIEKLDLLISDGNYSSKYPRADEFVSEGIPFIRANNLSHLTVISDDMRFISRKKHQELQKGHLKERDVLMTTRGDIGKVALVPTEYAGANINAQLVLLRPTSDRLSPEYLLWVFDNTKMKRLVESYQTGTALRQLPIGKLTQIPLPLPPTDLQKGFANIANLSRKMIGHFKLSEQKAETLFESLQQRAFTGELFE